jgi:bile acid-coenzyme A ligase
MTTMSYGAAMRWLAERDPESEAIVHADEHARIPRITRGELDRLANRLGRDYQQRGVKEGDLVTIALPNGIEFFAACLALWRLGATPQPVSSHLPVAERQAIIDLVDPPLVIGAPPEECGGRPALPPGHEPAATLSGDPLPECAPRYARPRRIPRAPRTA